MSSLILTGQHRLLEHRPPAEMMSCERELRIVPDATHLFEEPGTLEIVVEYARDWFSRHLWEDRDDLR